MWRDPIEFDRRAPAVAAADLLEQDAVPVRDLERVERLYVRVADGGLPRLGPHGNKDRDHAQQNEREQDDEGDEQNFSASEVHFFIA
jgi:hypothetical protein